MLTKLFIAGFSAKSLGRRITPSRPKGMDKHLSVFPNDSKDAANLSAPLSGYCPGRPPRYGAVALTETQLVFCQKTRLGETLTYIQLSQISAYEVSRLIRHHLIKVYSPGLTFEFATRMQDKDIKCFLSLLSLRLKRTVKQI